MNDILHKFILAVLSVAMSGGFALAATAQTPPLPVATPQPKKVMPAAGTAAPAPPAPWVRDIPGGDTTERSIAVASNVNFTLCVTEGNLKINGWNRDEVRVFVEGGSKFSFKVVDRAADGKPVWISLVNTTPKPGTSECIWGGAVEIDVPVGTSLNLTSKAIQASIDSVRKAAIKTAGGDISVRNIKEGVTASTYQGDVTLEESWGPVDVETTTGNIVVVDSGPSDVGDTFKARTNGGAVSLTRVTHRQQDVSSISGSVFFNGELKNGGSYGFNTTNGTIRLLLPLSTACRLAATFTSGSFASELPFQVETENISPGDLKSIVAKVGPGGDALLKLTTAQGLIGIKKQ
jgi:hypothetical protein